MTPFTTPMDPPDDWVNLRFHPLSELVEFGSNIDFEGMAADMTNNGYDSTKPIVLLWTERKRFEIIGGRHRHQSARKAEVVPTFALLKTDPLKFIQRELRRQHLSESQRALAAASMVTTAHGGDRSKTSIDVLPIDKAAETMNVSPASVDRAKKVMDKGTPELQEAVKSGQMKVSTAAQVADEDEETQREIVKENEPVKCANCKRRGSKLRDCPACKEAQAKADKPQRPKKKGKNLTRKKGKNLTRAGKVLDWNWFDRQVGEMNRFFLELKVKDAARRDFVMKQLMQFSAVARDWKKEEAK